MKIKTPSEKAITVLHHFEGLKLKPYLCPAGIPTIGFGNTYYEDGGKVTMKDSAITVKRANSLFQNVASDFHKQIVKSIKELLKLGLSKEQIKKNILPNLGIKDNLTEEISNLLK
jgi:GH24 family phage-related lysozyme (muramidase)